MLSAAVVSLKMSNSSGDRKRKGVEEQRIFQIHCPYYVKGKDIVVFTSGKLMSNSLIKR